ncbi:hypothetical protein DYB38_001582 [Aphanomyces astaci]|uniref:Uncharacterized protein n=1 Tax=Aphanomyces astaci TaxID=112090 RepID=A0A397DHM2_APHAT|nr:hypothetical protein DYB38_001582 [Aphanomyces astaci]
MLDDNLIPTLTVDGHQNTVFITTKNQSTRLIHFSLVNNAPITAGSVVHLGLSCFVPPASGIPDTYSVQLLGDSNSLLDTVTAQPVTATQPGVLHVGYVGMQSHRAAQDGGLLVSFSAGLAIPANGEYLLQLHASFNLTSSVELHMLTSSGGYTTSQANNAVKIKRTGDGAIIPAGSTIAFWLRNVWNPASDGVLNSVGVLKTTTAEAFVLEQVALDTTTVYSGKLDMYAMPSWSCLSQHYDFAAIVPHWDKYNARHVRLDRVALLPLKPRQHVPVEPHRRLANGNATHV